MTINKQIQDLQKKITCQVTTPEELQAFKHTFISKKGVLATLFTQLRHLPLQLRKSTGKLLNELKKTSQQKYHQLQSNLHTIPSATSTAPQDITLPPVPAYPGALHPLTHITQKIIHIFQRTGFSIADGPEIENEWNNFTALNFLPDHPARQMQDTFFIKQHTKQKSLLRTHTSSVQARTLQNISPPIRVLSTGKVFRKETISARTHCTFHQLEALYINKNVNFLSLKATVFFLYTISLIQKPKYASAPPTSLLQSPAQR